MQLHDTCKAAECRCACHKENVLEETKMAKGLGWPMGQVDASHVSLQPEGWHPCLKQKTRCIIEVHDLSKDAGYFGGEVKHFEATNSCHVDDAEVCPRVTAGAKTGEGYELCGPPNHAEQEAAKLVSAHYPDGIPGPSVAYLYGHFYLCQECQVALTDVGVRTFFITGEPA